MRAFGIGNGPSLNRTPMEKMRGEFTIACNRFNLMGLDWAPDWWIMADVRHEDGWWDWKELLARKSMFVFRDQERELVEPYHAQNAIFMPRCEHIGGDFIPTEWHLPTPCDYGGSISVAIQAAATLGRSPIYLVGGDLSRYRGPEAPDVNHFHPEYCPYKIRKSTGEEMITPQMWEETNRRLVLGHEISRDSTVDMGIAILNATVGGHLEVYERGDVHEVLS